MRPEVAIEVREWLLRASEDLREAEHDIAAMPPLVRGAVFHCQQAAEKAIKAFLAAHETAFRRTRDLDELGTAATRLDPSLSSVMDRAVDLTPYAWRFRYPGVPVDPTVDEVKEALALARGVYCAILSRLPAEVRP